ncbi:MAG: glycosyltransferase family 2 protein [Bacteroidales bacterium]
MELSVIIISFNVCDYLRQALASVITATTGISREIIVVDNRSSDGSVAMIRGEFREVRLILSESNEGYAAGCNKGIRASAGDFILILNPDTVVEPDSIKVAMTFMQAHPDAGAAGARMVNGDGNFLPESKRGFPSPLTSFFRLTGIGKLFPRSAFFNAYYLGHLSEYEVCKADILTGAFMLIRREALDRAGLFDTAFFMYGEDIDLCWRIRKAGFFNYYLPEVRITHFKGRSAMTDREASLRHFYDAMKIFACKHLGSLWHLPVKAVVTIIESGAITSLRIRRLIKK